MQKVRVVLCLVEKEFRQNLWIYLGPLLAFTPLAVLRIAGSVPLALGTGASLALLVAAAVMAIVFGLQSFGAESDRRTLDFLLARPRLAVLMTERTSNRIRAIAATAMQQRSSKYDQ